MAVEKCIFAAIPSEARHLLSSGTQEKSRFLGPNPSFGMIGCEFFRGRFSLAVSAEENGYSRWPFIGNKEN
jgi:hypothetical protein